jgi:hypothetical protein
MQKYIFIIILLFPFSLNGQINIFNFLADRKIEIIGCAITGIADAGVDGLVHRYPAMKRKFNLNDNFWNAEISWRNKHELGNPDLGERFPLSRTALVFTTDGFHLLKSVRNVSITATTVHFGLTYKNKSKLFREYEVNNYYSLNNEFLFQEKKPKKFNKILNIAAEFVFLRLITNVVFELTFSQIK